MNQLEIDTYKKKAINFNNNNDVALYLEENGAIDYMYSLIATGAKIKNIASEFDLDSSVIEHILKRTPHHQKKYMISRAVSIGNMSMDVLERFGSSAFMEQEEKAAAAHHKSVAEMSLKAIGGITQDNSVKIVVNSNTIVASNTPPPIPNEIKEII